MSEPYHPHAHQSHDPNNQPIIPEMVHPVQQTHQPHQAQMPESSIHGHVSEHSHGYSPNSHHHEDFLNSVLDGQSHASEKTGAKKIVYKIIAFEERHPWMFFGITAVIIFLIVVGVISVFINKDDSSSQEQVETQKEVPQNDVKDSEKEIEQSLSENTSLSPTFADSLSHTLSLHPLLTNAGMYDTLVYQNNQNIFLAGYFENAQILDKLLQIDIRQKILETEQKEAVYQAYYQLLKETHEEAVSNFAVVTDLKDELKSQEDAVFDQLRLEKKELQSAFLNGGKNELLSKVALTDATALKLTEVQSKYSSADILFGAYKRRIPLSEARLKDLEVNKRVIIENITIVPIEKSGIEYRPTNDQLNTLNVSESEVNIIKPQLPDSISSDGNIINTQNVDLNEVAVPKIRTSPLMDGAFNPLEREAIDNIFGPFFR